jgi:hypothetical protein
MSALDGFLVVQKFGTRLAASAEIFGVRFGRTPDEEYQRAVDLEQHRAEAADREQQLARMWDDVLDEAAYQGDHATTAVLHLHAPDSDSRSWLTCPLCDADELDPGPWPCRTVKAIAGAYGIEVPQ